MTLPSSAVPTAASAIDALPQEYKTESHPVLDGLATGLAGMCLEHEEWSDTLCDESDVLEATGVFLEEIGEAYGVVRTAGEEQEAYRTRVIGSDAVVTPQAIVANANVILSAHTAAEAQLCEGILDTWFVSDGTPDWAAFIGDGDTELSPKYLDRLYADDVDENSGVYRHNAEPGGALVTSDSNGRAFLLRVPDIDGLTPTEELAVYQNIASSVARIKGQGVRFELLVDGKL